MVFETHSGERFVLQRRKRLAGRYENRGVLETTIFTKETQAHADMCVRRRCDIRVLSVVLLQGAESGDCWQTDRRLITR